MRSKADIDLHEMLKNPVRAREFIAGVDWSPLSKPEVLILGENDLIHFKNMTDRDAIRAAEWILNTLEIPKIERSAQLELFPH